MQSSATAEEQRLRAWLHRIEEACARRGASDAERQLREAALSALKGQTPPLGCGQLKGA